MIAAAIGACEIAFWVVLLSGLTARYVLGQARVGAVLLVCVPLVDVVLLAVTVIDLANGTRAGQTHGLAAVYLGFSVVFGPTLIRGADQRFAQRYADGRPAPTRQEPPEDGLAVHWRLWTRCVLACVLAGVVLGALVLIAGGPGQTRALWANGGWFAQLGGICVLWFLLGPAWTGAAERLRGRAAR